MCLLLVGYPATATAWCADRGGSLRKTWKEVGLGLLNLLAVAGVIAAVQSPLHKYSGSVDPAVLAALCLGVYVAACKWIERRSPAELAVKRAPAELAAGMLLGLALFSSVMAILGSPASTTPLDGALTGSWRAASCWRCWRAFLKSFYFADFFFGCPQRSWEPGEPCW